jgi:hypothetical protein
VINYVAATTPVNSTAAIATACASVITAIGGIILALTVFIPMLRTARATHTLVNQAHTDAQNYQFALIRAMRAAGVEVPIDQSHPDDGAQIPPPVVIVLLSSCGWSVTKFDYPADRLIVDQPNNPGGHEMLTGHMTCERIDNRRIWTLTVPEMPRPGQLIEWTEPAMGHMPAQTGVRGWITGCESTVPGTEIISVATAGTRWVIMNVVKPMLNVRNADDIITAITEAPTNRAALNIMLTVPAGTVRAVADQLYIDTEHVGTHTLRCRIVTEARS